MTTTTTAERPVPRSSARARPMPPAERRAALAAATLPLLLAHGTAVTTRQIAEASGVAEGTLFRVFPDKEALICATIEAALDPRSLYEDLAAVDTTAPLRARLLAVTTILQGRLVSVIGLMMAIGMHGPPGDAEARRESNQQTIATIARLLEPDRRQLRLPPAEVARLLRLLTFSGSHPSITDGHPLTAHEIVSLVLDGVLVRQRPRPIDAEATTC
jgi:AcrR family transcriptional regulator